MKPLSPAQITVIQALAIGAPVTAAAKLADVSRTTIYSWLEDPHFHQAYGYAHQEYAMTIRDRLQNMAAKALDRLEAVIDNPNATPAVLLKAALAILNRAQGDWTLPSATFEFCAREIREAERRAEAAQAEAAQAEEPQPIPPQPDAAKPNAESAPPEPVQIARSAPCPCGSGQKFKRCCGRSAPPLLNTPVAA